jgi:hypothetical protein
MAGALAVGVTNVSTSIDQAFIKQFEEEVHQAYQRMGSKLRNTVRVKNGVKGSSTTFQKVGKGTADTKARHASVPVMNLDHTPVECTLQDFYAGDWVDALDELKINIDERQVLANAGSYALGRKTDEMIITELGATTQTIVHNAEGLTKAKILSAFETLGDNDVPDDGDRWGLVSWQAWTDLLNITEFASSDFVGPDELPWKGTQAKRWLGATWMAHSGLPGAGATRLNYLYHKSAIGHAVGQDVKTDITWHGDKAAHFVANSMSQGAKLIDALGIVEIETDES